jgi:hypothetical protein
VVELEPVRLPVCVRAGPSTTALSRAAAQHCTVVGRGRRSSCCRDHAGMRKQKAIVTAAIGDNSAGYPWIKKSRRLGLRISDSGAQISMQDMFQLIVTLIITLACLHPGIADVSMNRE